MGNPFHCAALASLILALGAPSLLGQVRAKVPAELESFIPSPQVKGALEVAGTETLTDLGNEWSSQVLQFNPDLKVTYLPRLSRAAARELVEGARGLVLLARELTEEELKAFQAKFGYPPLRIPVCLDATIVFVHKNNPLTSITLEQLDAIYGRDRLGGAKAPLSLWGDLKVKGDLGKRPILAYLREEGAATRDSLQATALLGGPFRPDLLIRPDSPSLAQAVVSDETAIAVGSLSSWYTGVKVLPVLPYRASDSRPPNQENVTSGRYPMPRLCYAYVNRTPGKPLDPLVSEFLHFVLSREGQGVAADVGILPAPGDLLLTALKRLER